MTTRDTDEFARAAERRHTMTCGNQKGPVGTIKQSVDGFVRRIDFEPGYDCLAFHGEAGRRCHGRHGMNLRFLLVGEEGATQFLFYASDWLPGSLDTIGSTRSDLPKHGVMAADLGFHWTRPVYDGQESMDSECEYLCGARCFYDGSGLNAGPVLEAFLLDGPDAVWERLEDYHASCSEGAAAASVTGRSGDA